MHSLLFYGFVTFQTSDMVICTWMKKCDLEEFKEFVFYQLPEDRN
jgi:hypothetical protein